MTRGGAGSGGPVRRVPRETAVLVTGASGGIGSAIAERFAADGCRVALHYSASAEAVRAAADRCASLGAAQVLTARADVRSRAEVLRMREELKAAGFVPDVLVNNAGVAHYGMLCDVTDEEWDRVMDVNLKGTFLCTQAFMEDMVSRKYGRIINISSVWGLTGASCEAVYSAAKGGINAFTKALAKELALSGVSVNAVAPGAVRTAMLDALDSGDLEALAEEIPAGRLGEPYEIAESVRFLAQPESGYLTGQILSPNGGWVT
ncbi:3-oxoacyl-ACP reductase FabG [Saccharibacillus sp. CPCC 101409]|uniref:elongation factor P 5-aminopentanone reductase n=1 Tax=Saccharibacillus sp. CPCC 101409 TaxID=3058041 RepID=UPI002673EAD5|nr:3-oxoacyl-ACP reductase FabG [Saccharibacillus sp. CPCC 101409]MDO3410640.1 3-oxoacyl-ACP reductase FabG [Saccharibacillus sp. CPCC 101409]